MMRLFFPFLLVIVMGLLFSTVGCTPPEETSLVYPEYGSPPGEDPPDSRGGSLASPRMAIVDYRTIDFSDPETVTDYARAEILVTPASSLWRSDMNLGVASALKAENPDIKIIGYVNAHGSWLRWGDEPDRDPEADPYGWDFYQATKPYWSYTTEGDTMMAWKGQVLLNILNEDCRAAMVGALVDHWYAHDNVFDGIFWDHFNQVLWVPSSVPGVNGEMDLDGNGIPHREDPDEILAYRLASEALIQEARAALGNDVIQFVNGDRAAKDSTFATLVDGMMYEHFPQVGYRGGEEMRQALDPANPNSLFAARTWPRTENGGPWLILTNKYRTSFVDDNGNNIEYRNAEFSRVAALLTGTLVSYHCDEQLTHYGWPEVEFDLGEPLGGVSIDGDQISREFQHGMVWLNMTNGGDTFPFDFRIEGDEGLLQSFAYPSHFP